MAHVHRIQKGISSNLHIYWAIDLLQNQDVIGTICLWNFDLGRASAELGYELSETHQKKDYMTEALTEVINYATVDLELKELEAYTHENNDASTKLLLRQGFTLKGYQEEKHSRTQQAYRYAIYSKSW